MASYLRPRRGTNALATSQAIVLKKGEVFFEIGNSGTPTTGANAKAFGKIKMGDGTTAYSNLGYFVDVDTTAVAWDNTGYTSATSASQGADFYTNLNNMVPTATVKTIFTNTKALLYNLATKVTKLNNDKADKTSVPTALSQLTADSTHRLVTDTEKSTWNGKANSSDITSINTRLNNHKYMILAGISNAGIVNINYIVSLTVYIPSSSIPPSKNYYRGSMSDFLNKLEYNKAYYVTGVMYRENVSNNKICMVTPMVFAKANTNYNFPSSFGELSSGYFGYLYYDGEDYQVDSWKISEADSYFNYIYSQTYIELI